MIGQHEAAVGPANILLVDDRAENLLALQAILSDANHCLVLAHSGEEALNAILERDFAVILLDVAMPEMDGFYTASLIKQRPRCRNTPIIFVTASIYDIENIFRGYAVGAVDYLYKPISAEIVRAKVAVFVEMYRQRERISQQAQLLEQSARNERELLTIRAEAALSASEAQYEATARQAPFGIALVHKDGRWVRFNQRLGEILGYPSAELPPLMQLLHPDDSLSLERLHGGEIETYRQELRLLQRDGCHIWVSATFSRLIEGVNDGRLAVVVEDISERKWMERWQGFLNQASEALLSSLDYQKSLADVAHLAVCDIAAWCAVDLAPTDETALQELVLIHRDAGQTAAVRQARQADPTLTGHAAADPRRKATLRSDVAGEASAAVWLGTALKSLLHVPMVVRGKPLGVLTLATQKPGRAYRTADLLMAQDLANRCALAIENARLYEQAQRAVRIRDDFLSIASHELRTPLTPLRLQLQRIIGTRNRPPANLTPERVREILHRSECHVQRLSSLIDNLLDVSRITSGRLTLDIETVCLVALTRDVASRFSEELSYLGACINFDLPPTAVGQWDRLRLEQVLTNLLSNAVKYGGGKAIDIKVRLSGDRVQWMVRDHGIGIDPSKQAQIFERFERAVPIRAYGGLGLGLFIARQILDAHGGTICVDSQLGQGTTFTVELPTDTKRRQAPASYDLGGDRPQLEKNQNIT